MKISECIQELKQRNILLYYFGWTNMVLLLACAIGFVLDDRNVTGINAWIKPMKFAISVTVYVWTFAWLLHYLKSMRSKYIISWVVFVTMLIENVIITVQAARGESSHYNITTSLNALLFSVMGVFIGINALINFYALTLFCIKGQTKISGHQLMAWQGGLLLFFLGGISGGLMIANLGHTFGSPDGGPGLPFTNWSTQAGDMRTAHFFTLHGLQALPLLVRWLAPYVTKPSRLVAIVCSLYFAVCLGMHYLALAGKPLIHLQIF